MMFLSIFVVTLAHIVRAYRWRLFISIYENPSQSVLLRSIAFGNTLNIFLPFKTGDVVRAVYCGRNIKNGKALSFSSVITERLLDVFVVGLIFAFFLITNKSDLSISNSLIFYIYLMLVVALVCFLFYVAKKYIKKSLKLLAGIFNQSIELKILKFSWALIRNFKDVVVRISKIKLVFSTVFMWGLYILSYYFISLVLNEDSTGWENTFIMLFSKDSLSSSSVANFSDIQKTSFYFFLFLILPNFLVYVFSFMPFFSIKSKNNTADNKETCVSLLPHINQVERLAFLERYFSGEDRDFIRNYLKINSHISIIRDYSAGSNATTMLCMNKDGNFFRKYAFGADGEKLYEQILWLKNFKDILPLPKILREEKNADFCYYDMPATPGSVGLFEYSHSMPIDKSWHLIKNVLEVLEQNLYVKNKRRADIKTIEKYVETKVQKNISKIQNGTYLKPLMKYDVIIINGKPFKNLNYYLPLLDKSNLVKVFKNDSYSEIHGDLTIENIICTRGGKDDWYIIDPNTGNVHDSPNLDYGKLLQSIAGGYEFLMNTQNVEISENQINFISTKSQVYEILHKKLDEFMIDTFPTERVKSIYYHHIIHWLRLMPYKIEKNGVRSVLFYAGLLMVLDEVERKFRGV